MATNAADAVSNEHALCCIRCGYILRGISPEGACPECGTTVARSRGYALLEESDRTWLAHVAAGLKVLQAALAGGAVLLALFALGPLQSSAVLAPGAAVAAALAWGVWRVTEKEPQREAPAGRRTGRCCGRWWCSRAWPRRWPGGNCSPAGAGCGR